jgi:hypothetical protein
LIAERKSRVSIECPRSENFSFIFNNLQYAMFLYENTPF